MLELAGRSAHFKHCLCSFSPGWTTHKSFSPSRRKISVLRLSDIDAISKIVMVTSASCQERRRTRTLWNEAAVYFLRRLVLSQVKKILGVFNLLLKSQLVEYSRIRGASSPYLHTEDSSSFFRRLQDESIQHKTLESFQVDLAELVHLQKIPGSRSQRLKMIWFDVVNVCEPDGFQGTNGGLLFSGRASRLSFICCEKGIISNSFK